MAITINGSGTITGVSAGGLPDGCVDNDTLANSSVTVNGTAISLGGSDTITAGKILQVLSTTKTDTFSTGSTSYTDVTGLSVSITPSSTSSKIQIFVNFNMSTDDYRNSVVYQIVRDSTAICIGDSAGSRQVCTGGWEDAQRNPTYEMISHSMNYIDSPSTTSATTYKIQVANPQQYVGGVAINATAQDTDSYGYPRGASTITVMEIAG